MADMQLKVLAPVVEVECTGLGTRMKKTRQTGVFKDKQSAKHAAEWWRARDYGARLRKVSGGYVIDLYK